MVGYGKGSCLKVMVSMGLWLSIGLAPEVLCDEQLASQISAELKAAPEIGIVQEVKLGGEDLRFWKMHWQRFGLFYAQAGGDYFICESWRSKFESSLGVTVDGWRKSHSRVEAKSAMGWVTKKTHAPSLEESQAAAVLLPSFEVGSYGMLHSVKVLKVVGPVEMIVGEPWLLDAEAVAKKRRADELVGERYLARVDRAAKDARLEIDRYFGGSSNNSRGSSESTATISSSQIRNEIDWRFEQREKAVKRQLGAKGLRVRLLGFSTEGVIVGERFHGAAGRRVEGKGMSVVLVDDASLERKATGSSLSRFGLGREAPTITAVSGGLFKVNMKEDEFVGLVHEAGMNRKDFVEAARGQMRQYGNDAEPRVLSLLEMHRKKAGAEREAALAAKEADEKRTAKEKDGGGGGDGLIGKSEWYRQQMAKKAAEAAKGEKGVEGGKAVDPLAGKSDWYKAQYAKKQAEAAGEAGKSEEGSGAVVKDDKYFQEKYGKKKDK